MGELSEQLVQPAAGSFGSVHFKIFGLLIAGENGLAGFFARLDADFGGVAEPEQALVLPGEIGFFGRLQGLLHEVTRGGGLRDFKIEPEAEALI